MIELVQYNISSEAKSISAAGGKAIGTRQSTFTMYIMQGFVQFTE